VARKDVVDIAVEDPAEGFQKMRTAADLKYLKVNKLVQAPVLDVLLNKEKLLALQKKTKLSPVLLWLLFFFSLPWLNFLLCL